MRIELYNHSMRTPFIQMMKDYFQELEADIPENILGTKLIELIEDQVSGQILHVAMAYEGLLPIGFSIYQIDDPASDWCKRPGWGCIREFYIAPSHRRAGRGFKLAEFAEHHLRELNATALYLTSDSALPFWLACGWRDTGMICSNQLPILEK